MDIHMPVMDGVEAAQAIRALEARDGRPRTPIVAVTANALAHQVEGYLAAGMDGHVAKPIEVTKLYAAIEAAMASARLAQARLKRPAPLHNIGRGYCREMNTT
jgi:CheY-like chemotaxis protein